MCYQTQASIESGPHNKDMSILNERGCITHPIWEYAAWVLIVGIVVGIIGAIITI